MISIEPAEIERFLAEDDGKPVTMLNLVRFKPDGGRDRYQEYLKMAAPLLERYGAELLYAGDGQNALAAESGQAWDAVGLVRYPDRRSFASMIADPDYQRADPIRTSALVEAVLQPTRSMFD